MRKILAIWRQRIRFFRLEYFTRLAKKDFATIQSKKTPVVLVAGIYASGRSLLPLKKFLESQNYPVYLAPEKKNRESIPILAKRLQKQIQKIPAPKVQIVAHSMGGITVLKALQNKKTLAKVLQVITLGSPLNGCALGSLAFWEHWNNQKYLALHSPAIKKINSHKKINQKICALYAYFDEIVFPKRNMKLENAKENKELLTYGHVGLILYRRTWEEVAKRLVK
jgi:predicted alpha/beta hydrolase family esterase